MFSKNKYLPRPFLSRNNSEMKIPIHLKIEAGKIKFFFNKRIWNSIKDAKASNLIYKINIKYEIYWIFNFILFRLNL